MTENTEVDTAVAIDEQAQRMLKAMENAGIRRNPLGRQNLKASKWLKDGNDERYELSLDGRLYRGKSYQDDLVGKISPTALARLSAPLTCGECGKVYAGNGALASHAGSFRCEIDAAAGRLEQSGFERCGSRSFFLKRAGVDVVLAYTHLHERGPEEFDEINTVYWAPSWAVRYASTLSELRFPRDAKEKLISDAARLKRPERRSTMVLSLLAKDDATREAVKALPASTKNRLAARIVGSGKVTAEVEREVADAVERTREEAAR